MRSSSYHENSPREWYLEATGLTPEAFTQKVRDGDLAAVIVLVGEALHNAIGDTGPAKENAGPD